MRLLLSLLVLSFTTIGLPALHLTERTASAAPAGVHRAQARKKKRAARPQKAKKTVKKTEKAEKTKKNDRGFEL